MNKLHRCLLTALTASLLVGCAVEPPLKRKPSDVQWQVITDPLPRTAKVEQSQLKQLSPNSLAANFVDRVIHDLPVDQHLQLFANMDANTLDAALDTSARQIAFWLNVYNGYTQYFLKTDPSLYLNDRPAYFGLDQVAIAGHQVSLEDIEHGVLRRGATIYTLGHLRVLFLRREFIRQFAVDEVDYRIHFALNCGALSCPPVAAYQPEQLDAQLDAMSRHYLQREVRFDASSDIVHIPALMLWFSADFGGRAKHKRAILKYFDLIPSTAEPSLEYLPYDWTIKVESYAAVLPRP